MKAEWITRDGQSTILIVPGRSSVLADIRLIDDGRKPGYYSIWVMENIRFTSVSELDGIEAAKTAAVDLIRKVCGEIIDAVADDGGEAG